MLTRRTFGLLGPLTPLGLLPLSGALAQPSPWPDRPVRVVVPFGPGGAIDVLARILAPHFPTQANGQPLVVENRGGAGGTVGAGYVAQARPDGYTLMMAEQGSSALAHELYRDLPYDPRRAFTPIVFLADLPMVLVARPGLAARDLAGLLDQARERPGSLTYASVGVGHVSHLVVELLQRSAGTGTLLLHVTYRSGAEVIAAVIKGEVDLTLTSLSTGMPFLQSGAVRALAVAAPESLPALPGVPPMAATVPGVAASLWYGVVGPAGMSPNVVARANAAFNAILALVDVREALRRQQAAEIVGGPAERFAAHIRAEVERWTPVVRAAGIRAE